MAKVPGGTVWKCGRCTSVGNSKVRTRENWLAESYPVVTGQHKTLVVFVITAVMRHMGLVEQGISPAIF